MTLSDKLIRLIITYLTYHYLPGVVLLLHVDIVRLHVRHDFVWRLTPKKHKSLGGMTLAYITSFRYLAFSYLTCTTVFSFSCVIGI
ncbi:hypothetical protein GGS20DRAFT_570689 [Poronia punctata]|nr:hypothetical protein GGS20DRAFT_570689 [Poronia punctata]